MAPPQPTHLNDEEVDLYFGRGYRALKHDPRTCIVKTRRKNLKLPDDAEEFPNYLGGEIETTQQILDDADELLQQYNEIEKRFKGFYR